MKVKVWFVALQCVLGWISSHAQETLFLDEFKGPTLNPLWVELLPQDETNSLGSLMTYLGAPSYSLESLGTNSILRMTNSLAYNQRRGWATDTNFAATGFRYEVRFNDSDRTNYFGGLLEMWVIDAANSNRFDFASVVYGVFDSAGKSFCLKLYKWRACRIRLVVPANKHLVQDGN